MAVGLALVQICGLRIFYCITAVSLFPWLVSIKKIALFMAPLGFKFLFCLVAMGGLEAFWLL